MSKDEPRQSAGLLGCTVLDDKHKQPLNYPQLDGRDSPSVQRCLACKSALQQRLVVHTQPLHRGFFNEDSAVTLRLRDFTVT